MKKSGLKWVLMILVAGLTAGPALPAAAGEGDELFQRMSEAWTTVNTRFYDARTSQFYTAAPARLPSAERVKRLDPNDCGYGTGMDDVPLFAGILLAAICDQYAMTHDEALKEDAASVYKGLALCATAHGIPGFVARGVCPEDGKSIYITSSRDQVTHLVHAFWRYYRSPLCNERTKPAIREILQAVADRMTRNVTPENDYDFLRADGTRDRRGICRMLDVYPHEAARLAMIYAAAWDVGGSEEHRRLYRKHLPRAIEESLEMPNLTEKQIASLIPPYSLVQMQCSLEVLHALENEGTMKSRIAKTMLMVAEFTARKRHPNCRQRGELALAQLMSDDFAFTRRHKEKLVGAVMRAEFETDSPAAYCLLGAYWKARRNGLFPVEEESETVQARGPLQTRRMGNKEPDRGIAR